MGQRSDPAGSLNEMVGVSGVAALKDQFDAAEHLAGTPGVDHLSAGHLHFDPKVAFDSGNRIYGDSLIGHMISSL
jgi:hypothetical protein